MNTKIHFVTFNSKIDIFLPNVKIPEGSKIKIPWFRRWSIISLSWHPNVCIKVMIWSVSVVYLGYISLVDTSLPLSRYQNTWQTWFRPMNVDKSVSNQTYTPIINKQSMSNLQRLNLTWRNSIKPLVLFFKVTSFKTGQKNLFSSETKWNEASELNWTWTTTINFSRGHP